MCSSTRPAPAASPRRCALPTSPSSTARSSRRTPRRNSHGHLVLAMPRSSFGVESHGGKETDPLHYGLFHEHPELRDGHLIIGDKPGFGLEIDWDFVEKHKAGA